MPHARSIRLCTNAVQVSSSVKTNTTRLLVCCASIVIFNGIISCGGGGTSPPPTAPVIDDPAPPPTPPPTPAPEQGASINVFANTLHSIGGITKFEREKFITIHASHTENDWFSVGENAEENLIGHFIDNYDVYFGRDTGGMAWQLGRLPEDPVRPGYIDRSRAAQNGETAKRNYATDNRSRGVLQRSYEHRNKSMIVAAQQRPYWPDGTPTRAGWALSQTSSSDTPFGQATAEYMSDFLAMYFNNNAQDPYGQPKPVYLEVMNEPLYELVTVAEEPVPLDTIFEFHNTVADIVRNTEYDGLALNRAIKIGGYTAAFPDFEKDNFARWHARDKRFIDIAGHNMDFISIHLYDFPRFGNREFYRSGANLEATFDMLEQYTQMTLGQPSSIVVSEYGAQVHNLNRQAWSPERDWLIMRSINSMMFSFLSRPHLIEKVIPFIPVKAEWGRQDNGQPYPYRLMRQANEAEGESGDLWVYSELVKYYALWQSVNGDKLYSHSNEVDLQHLAYADSDKIRVVVNNLELESSSFSLNLHDLAQSNIQSLSYKHLYADTDNNVVLDQQSFSMDDELSINAMATMVIEISLKQPYTPAHEAQEHKYYANTYLQAIEEDKEIIFSFEDLDTQNVSMGVLNLSLGRALNASLSPQVLINNEAVALPSDYKGVEQGLDGRGRETFFGTLEIPIKGTLLQNNNQISVTFEDSGGYISSATMRVINNLPEGALQ